MKKKDFAAGIKDGFPICLGYLSVSFAFGMRVVLAGLPVWLAGLISISNLTSAGQFAGTNLLLAGGSYAELAVSMLVINMRYFLMSLSLSQKVDGRFNTLRRLSASYGITDEIFAVSVGRKGLLSPEYMMGVILTPVLGWTAGTILGGVATELLPASVTDALGIALYAMFIAIIIPPARKSGPVLFAVVLAAAMSIAFDRLPLFAGLSGGWGIIIITVSVAALAAAIFPVAEEEEEAEHA